MLTWQQVKECTEIAWSTHKDHLIRYPVTSNLKDIYRHHTEELRCALEDYVNGNFLDDTYDVRVYAPKEHILMGSPSPDRNLVFKIRQCGSTHTVTLHVTEHLVKITKYPGQYEFRNIKVIN